MNNNVIHLPRVYFEPETENLIFLVKGEPLNKNKEKISFSIFVFKEGEEVTGFKINNLYMFYIGKTDIGAGDNITLLTLMTIMFPSKECYQRYFGKYGERVYSLIKKYPNIRVCIKTQEWA